MLFIGAGVYKLTTTGWMKSLRFCCREEQPPSLVPDEGADDDDDEGVCERQPVIQDEDKIPYTRTTSEGSFDKPV